MGCPTPSTGRTHHPSWTPQTKCRSPLPANRTLSRKRSGHLQTAERQVLKRRSSRTGSNGQQRVIQLALRALVHCAAIDSLGSQLPNARAATTRFVEPWNPPMTDRFRPMILHRLWQFAAVRVPGAGVRTTSGEIGLRAQFKQCCMLNQCRLTVWDNNAAIGDQRLANTKRFALGRNRPAFLRPKTISMSHRVGPIANLTI